MLEAFLVPQNTTVTANGDGQPVDVSSASHRVFLLSLDITEVVEQESLDVSLWGSADGAAWGEQPLARFPQKFYRGEHPLLLNLTAEPGVNFLRAHWDVGRWGRGSLTPTFQFHLGIREVPKEVLEEVTAAARSRA